jgi:hypothetical protein
MSEQVYNCGTIELTSAPYTGRRAIVGVFAINAESNDFQYHLRAFSRDEIPDLEDRTYASLGITLYNWMERLKNQSDTPIDVLALPRGGLIQFVPRSSFLVSSQDPQWFEKIIVEYFGQPADLV